MQWHNNTLSFYVICFSLQMIILRNYATLNINGIQNKTKQTLLRDFIQQNGIDVMFLQEVTTPEFKFLGPQYNAIVNTGENN